MNYRRILTLLLCFFIIITSVPGVFAEEDDEERGMRTFYIHAREGQLTETPQYTDVKYNQEVNVYLAVDNPNKGYVDGVAHAKPQFDMNGYTAKVYYDTAYLELLSDENSPIYYQLPNESGESGTTEVKPDASDNPETVPDENADFYVIAHDSVPLDGTTWEAAYITVFFTGTYLPEKTEEGWYNLFKIPFKAIRRGSTQVYVDFESDDPYTFVAFAKDIPGGGTSPVFTCNFEHGGYHTINIEESARPLPPVPNPGEGYYTDSQYVTLTAAEGCTIFYSTNGKDFVQYIDSSDPDKKEKIVVARSGSIWCYAQKDDKRSETKQYVYHIIPKTPVLFNSSKDEPISNIYKESSAFTVYAADSSVFGPVDIVNGNKIYYTFDNLQPGDAGWIELPADQSIAIDKKSVVRLVTYNVISGEYSDVSEYHLGIVPEPVVSSHATGEYDEKIDVVLSTTTTGAEIYYTTDGSDPRVNGVLYTVPITLGQDTTLRAIAKYDGEISDIRSWHYIFNLYDDYGVDAFYPSGGYEGSVNVTLTPNNPDNKVWYSVDGGNTWQEFDDVITVDKDTEIIAKTQDKNGVYGSEYKFTYQIKPLPPVFAPESTQFTNSDRVAIFCPERTEDNKDEYELFYTIGNGDPIVDGISAGDSDSAEITINGYTVISAAIKRNGVWSTVVKHSYDVVVQKPVKPLTTLLPGVYTHGIDNDEGFSTLFMPIPEGTDIYYVISYDGEFIPDPVPGEAGVIKYDGNPIDVKGNTFIKAVAVNRYNVKSDVGIFSYNIIPEAPEAAPSATIAGNKLPVVPVDAVKDSEVSYKTGGFENTFECETGRFWIDMNDGSAYEDEECTIPLGNSGTATNSGSAMLEISAKLDGVESSPNVYIYNASGKDDTLSPPYADKPTGEYEEYDTDGEGTLLSVKLNSLNDGDSIEYMLNNDGKWIPYTGEIKITGDTVVQARSVKNGKSSTVVGYVYTFIPLPPVITLPSGRYADDPTPETGIQLNPDSPKPLDNYEIFYRRNGDPQDFRLAWNNNALVIIDETLALKAYTRNRTTGKISKSTVHYYVVEQKAPASGAVEMASPYYGLKRLAAHLISVKPYSDGIRLFTGHPAGRIRYQYTYRNTDGTEVTTNPADYSNTPIFVSQSMEWIKVTAWLTDEDGNEIIDSRRDFDRIDFIRLMIPVTSLEGKGTIEFPKGTKYSIYNDYPEDEYMSIFYTTDGSDPSRDGNPSSKLYLGEELSLNSAVTVKTVYHSACGSCYECKSGNKTDCMYGVYGEVGTYNYTVPSVQYVGGGGGGGGGGYNNNSYDSQPTDSEAEVIDKTRRYTRDIFGQEHPTHVSYISGYPDGTVQPGGDITREEMAAILYRARNKKYDRPFTTTGEVFTDVEVTRWSVTEIEYMTGQTVISGYPDGEFKPARDLTRAEFASLIRRFCDIEIIDGDNVFPDLPDDHWAVNDIITLYARGYLTGYEDGTIRPEDNITRAEVMTVMNKILGRNPSDPYVKSLGFNPFSDLSMDKWYYTIVIEATVTHNYYLLDESDLEYKWEDWK